MENEKEVNEIGKRVGGEIEKAARYYSGETMENTPLLNTAQTLVSNALRTYGDMREKKGTEICTDAHLKINESIGNPKNIEIARLKERIAELEKELDKIYSEVPCDKCKKPITAGCYGCEVAALEKKIIALESRKVPSVEEIGQILERSRWELGQRIVNGEKVDYVKYVAQALHQRLTKA